MRVLVTGATGFIGRSLCKALSGAGHEPVAVSRSSGSVRWDPLADPIDPGALDRVEAVVHLAGESVGEGRWTKKKMRLIRDSRWTGTRNLVLGIAAARSKPRVLFSASAVGYYGDRADQELPEESAPGEDFLARVCRGWEEAAADVEKCGVRRVSGRLGIVLGAGGALPRMAKPFSMYLGGPIGSGDQWMSWIHLQDACRMILFALERGEIAGPLNVVSPEPVRNRDFAEALGRSMNRPSWLRMPKMMLRLAVGRFATSLVMSQRCVPAKALREGFRFERPGLADALSA